MRAAYLAFMMGTLLPASPQVIHNSGTGPRTDGTCGVNANTGDIAWRVPLGSYDEVEAMGLKNAGATNMGGSIATAGGLVFIGATTDSKFRAFDSRTGKELWMARLDATADAAP